MRFHDRQSNVGGLLSASDYCWAGDSNKIVKHNSDKETMLGSYWKLGGGGGAPNIWLMSKIVFSFFSRFFFIDLKPTDTRRDLCPSNLLFFTRRTSEHCAWTLDCEQSLFSSKIRGKNAKQVRERAWRESGDAVSRYSSGSRLAARTSRSHAYVFCLLSHGF